MSWLGTFGGKDVVASPWDSMAVAAVSQLSRLGGMDVASAGSGYKLSLGADGPPGSYEDFDRADLFFVIGANMADCHPILFLRMMDRVKAGLGVPISQRARKPIEPSSFGTPLRGSSE